MADIETKRISELTAAQDIGDSDLFVIEQGGAAKKALGSVVRGAIGGGGSVTVDDSLSGTSEKPVQNKVIKAALDNKVDKISGKGLSTKDYTAAEKTKLAGIETGAQKNPDLSGYVLSANVHNLPSGGTAGQFLVKSSGTDYDAAWVTKNQEITVATGGAVTQALEAGKWYHFTGALTSLTVTLTTPASGELAQYHFDFISGATAPTVTLPDSVKMPDGFTVEANKRYEVDILNNYGAVMSWAIS